MGHKRSSSPRLGSGGCRKCGRVTGELLWATHAGASRRLDESLRARSVNQPSIRPNWLARSLPLKNPDSISILDYEGYVLPPGRGTRSNSSGKGLWGHDPFDLQSWEWTWHSPPPQLTFQPTTPSHTQQKEMDDEKEDKMKTVFPTGCHVCRRVGTSHLITVLKSEVPAARTPRPFVHSSPQDSRAASRGQVLCPLLGGRWGLQAGERPPRS